MHWHNNRDIFFEMMQEDMTAVLMIELVSDFF